MTPSLPNTLIDDAFWAACEGALDAAIESAKASASRWVWADLEADWIERAPLRSESFGRRPTKEPLRRKPKIGTPCQRYGFDDDGNAVYAARLEAGTNVLHNEIVWATVGSRTVQLLGEHGQRVVLVRVSVPEHDSTGRLRAVQTRHADGRQTRTEYTYRDEGQQVAAVLSHYPDRTIRLTPEYGEDGALRLLYAQDVDGAGDLTGEPTVVFVNAPPAEVKAAKALVEQRLAPAIARWAERHPALSDAYCLAIAYDPFSSASLLPAVGMGTNDDRKRWAQTGKRLAEYMWNPAEFAVYEPELPIDEAELLTAIHLVSSDIAQKAHDRVPARIFEGVATDLRTRSWARSLVVYAVDLELENLQSALRHAITPSQRRALEQQADA